MCCGKNIVAYESIWVRYVGESTERLVINSRDYGPVETGNVLPVADIDIATVPELFEDAVS
jgi:hypothetical protein